MGSNQSSPANADVGTFSIDPSGNITRKNPTRTSETKPEATSIPHQHHQQQQQYSEKENSNINSNDDGNIRHETPATPIDEPQSFIIPLQPVVIAAEHVKPPTSDELSLDEADHVVNSLKAKFKPDNLNMIGKQQSVFNEVERNLVQCYAANKNQTMNCSQAYQEYKDHVALQRNQLLKKSANVPLVTTVLVVITCLLLHITQISCYGAMSIDLGSEWMKVGLVAPSVQMDIVLNAQSQRKTPMAIAFSNGERFIGDTALDVASKYPERTYTHFLDLVGKSIEHESVKHYKQRFPYASITPATTTTTPEQTTLDHNSIILNHPQGLEFTPLELIAMMLEHAHDQVITRLNSNEPANDVVITVPPFFGAAERRVIEDAAKLVGLNVLRLTNTNSAFALSYGIFRHKDYLPESDANKTSILFFDQGASHTSVTLADYHLVEQVHPAGNGVSRNESLPTIRIRAQVYDRYLGGFDMQLKLRDHLLKTFAKKTGIEESKITKRGKSMAKLLKESGKVKKILSANTGHVVRVENVIDDKDLKESVNRQEFEELNKEYLDDRITNLLDKLFIMPGVSREEPLESVIIVGGNTRTPKIQQTLLDYFKLYTLGKSINADEGAALAALYQAASLGRGFRVKKFVLVEFNETTTGGEDPSANTTTTETPVEASATTDAPATGEQQKATLTAADPFEGSRKKLATLREQDHLRLQRLSSRNNLESLLSEARDKLDEKEDVDKLRQVSEAYTWLEDGPQHETDNITLLAEKYDSIHELVFPKPPPPPMFDPSTVDLSSVLSNETLKVLHSLNFTNPFARSVKNDTASAPPSSDSTTTTTPRTLEPAPAPSVAPTQSQERGPPPHSEL